MKKILKGLFKIVYVAVLLAGIGAAVFYFERKEKFLSFNDFVEELKGELATLPGIALLF